MISNEILGYISIAIMIIGNSIYLTSILKGYTKPHVFTWLAWGILTAIAFLAQGSDNAGPGSWTMGFISFTCFCYSVLALFKGEKDITRSDWICFITAIIAILLWYFIKTPIWSILLITVVDIIGYIPTIRKSYSKPYEEPVVPWLLAGLGVAVSLMALENLSFITAFYPLASVIINIVFIAMLLWRRSVLKNKNRLPS